MEQINEIVNIQEIDINEFEKNIYSYYLEIFSENERKTLKMIKSSFDEGYTKIIKINKSDNLCGYMIINKIKENQYAILDYFAILPQYRSKGIGTKALKLLIDEETKNKGIFIEIEKIGLGKDDKENILREKRKVFYEKVGFKKLNYDFVLFNVVYTPYIYSNIEEKEEKIVKQVFNMYEVIIGKNKVEKNCKYIKNLRFEKLNKENLKIAAKTQYEIFPNSSAYLIYKSHIEGKIKEFYTTSIAYSDDKPVGVVGLYDIPEYSDTVWLSWFGVLKEYRHMGFGKQLFDYAVEEAKKLNKKFFRLYTFEIWNSSAQKFYNKNTDMGEYYYNEKEKSKRIFEGKPKIFSKSLCDEKVSMWNNKYINISEDEEEHEKSVLLMKQDGII